MACIFLVSWLSATAAVLSSPYMRRSPVYFITVSLRLDIGYRDFLDLFFGFKCRRMVCSNSTQRWAMHRDFHLLIQDVRGKGGACSCTKLLAALGAGPSLPAQPCAAPTAPSIPPCITWGRRTGTKSQLRGSPDPSQSLASSSSFRNMKLSEVNRRHAEFY